MLPAARDCSRIRVHRTTERDTCPLHRHSTCTQPGKYLYPEPRTGFVAANLPHTPLPLPLTLSLPRHWVASTRHRAWAGIRKVLASACPEQQQVPIQAKHCPKQRRAPACSLFAGHWATTHLAAAACAGAAAVHQIHPSAHSPPPLSLSSSPPSNLAIPSTPDRRLSPRLLRPRPAANLALQCGRPRIESSCLFVPAPADGLGDSSPGSRTPTSPALSTASTADDEDDDIGSSPVLPLLPAPKLSERASAILRAPAFDLHDFQVDDDDEDESDDNLASDDEQFGTASWGSPYLRSDVNLRRQSYDSEESESEGSESFPIHSLDINTPFLRPPPLLLAGQPQTPAPSLLPTSAAAAVLVHRARRRNRGLTEGWIRTHTAGDQNTEARLWFSDGDSSEHSSLSGSETDWYHGREPRTPTPSGRYREPSSRSTSRYPRAISSVETLKAGDPLQAEIDDEMASSVATETGSVVGLSIPEHHNDLAAAEASQLTAEHVNGNKTMPIPPIKVSDKPLPREPPITPRIKKKVPWKGKNIMILIPRDEQRGLPGQPPVPLRQDEIERMFDSWTELGYNVDGFDLPAEEHIVAESQSRELWPSLEDLAQERYDRDFTVVLPDLN
ncbi:myosin heavy chain, partial [Trichoderma arundinaceum]